MAGLSKLDIARQLENCSAQSDALPAGSNTTLHLTHT